MSRRTIESLESRLLLTTYYVDTIADRVADDGRLSLREAVIAANTNRTLADAEAGEAHGDVIHFSPYLRNKTITLTGGEISITDDLWLGGMDRNLTIDAGNASRHFNVQTSQRVRIANFTLTNGQAEHGGSVVLGGGGQTVLRRIRFLNNTALQGGAVYNDGNAVGFSQTTFESNQAEFYGGAVYTTSAGRSEFGDSTFDHNATLNAISGGGAIYNSGDNLLILNSEFTNNSASIRGGAVFSSRGRVDVQGSRFEANGVSDPDEVGGGGAVALTAGWLWADDSVFVENHVLSTAGFGGAISTEGNAWGKISNSTIEDNEATEGLGGGLYGGSIQPLLVHDTQVLRNHAGQGGGGLLASSYGGLEIRRSTIQFNTTEGNGGGVGVSTPHRLWMEIHDTTIADNVADVSAGGLVGGWYLTMTNVTVARNYAGLANGSGGGLFAVGVPNISASRFIDNSAGRFGGGISLSNHTFLTLTDSVMTGNVTREANSFGGAISAANTVTLRGSTIQGNHADRGGGIFLFGGWLEATDSVISGNTADDVDEM